MDFAEFLAPFDAGTFRSQYYGKQPLHVRRNGAGSGLLPWQRFNDVLALTPYWNEESLKVYFKSRAALRENYCDTADVRPGTLAPVNPAKLKALTALGASIVANHLHRVCPEVGAVAAMLEREFAARAFANMYCSFMGVQAFQTHFDLPDLPAMPVVPRAPLPWAAAIEARTAEVREEYLAAVAAGAALSPYVDAATRGPIWQNLRGKLDWSSLHLYKAGAETPFSQLFPKTLAALEAADVVRLEGRPVELLFSRLRPGAHIPPHFGTGNHRITVHLPLIVPGDCEIRVGSARHAWREGELFAFDDSFEHEAWNRSDKDRVVLIFEAHHPDLRPEERAAIERAIGAREHWIRGAAGAAMNPTFAAARRGW